MTLFKNSDREGFLEYEEEFKKQNNTNEFNSDSISNITFGEFSGSSSQIITEFINLSNNIIKKDERYKFLVKKIGKNLKKRVKLPKCKLFKFYNSYRLLILRIAKGIKNTAKKLNFWEKWENNITEKEINEIQQIATNSCKIIEQNNKNSKKDITNKVTPSKRSKKNIQIKLSSFQKN